MKEKEAAAASGAHATEADAVPGAASAASVPDPPQRGATEADAVPHAGEGSGQSSAQGATTDATHSTTSDAAQDAAREGVATLIAIDDFIKVELRVGEILTAERIPKSDKLLRFTVDLAEAAPRQILAGIAEHYEPESLVGRKIVVVANLKPRKLRGFESQGMVLAASIGEAGRPVLATFAEDVPNGTRLK